MKKQLVLSLENTIENNIDNCVLALAIKTYLSEFVDNVQWVHIRPYICEFPRYNLSCHMNLVHKGINYNVGFILPRAHKKIARLFDEGADIPDNINVPRTLAKFVRDLSKGTLVVEDYTDRPKSGKYYIW